MANETWQSLPLSEVYEFRSGLSKPASEFGFGHGFLTFKDVLDNYFIADELTSLVNSTEREQQACSVLRGDVFLTRTSETQDELGMSCVALKDYDSATFNGFTKRLRPKSDSIVVPEYAAYYFRGPHFRRAVTAMSSLSTRASLNNSMLERLHIVLPPIEVQAQIGNILKVLDDRVALNHRMNETLESIIREVFRSWFVRFDPVRARLDDETDSDLVRLVEESFPATLNHMPSGDLIPDSWRVSTVGDELVTLLGGTPSRKEQEYWRDGTVPWIKSGMVNAFRVSEPSEFITEEAVEKSATKWLPRRTTLVAITGATLGQISLAEIECCANQSVVGVLPSEEIPGEFIYPWFLENVQTLVASQTGGAQQHINKGNVNELPILLPDPAAMSLYSKIITPVFDRIATNIFQTQTLKQIRDTLLPKLLSGQLQVPDADAEIAAVL